MSRLNDKNLIEKDTCEWPVYFFAIILCFAVWWGGMTYTHEYAITKFKSEQKVVSKENSLKDEEIKGLFGDSFGAVNALVSALAFAGVIVSLYFQRKDLKLQRQDLQLQRKELELTRGELQNQTEQYVLQNKTLSVQRFENTFFQMLHLHHEIVNGLTFQYVDQQISNTGMGKNVITITAHGRESFDAAFTCQTSSGWGFNPSMRGIIHKDGIEGYNKSNMPIMFDHYFRNLYRIIKFTEDNKLIDDKEKKEYIDLLRAQLSPYELVWLYYNGLSKGKEKMKDYIQNYSLLNNLRKDLLVETDKEIGEYDARAFQ